MHAHTHDFGFSGFDRIKCDDRKMVMKKLEVPIQNKRFATLGYSYDQNYLCGDRANWSRRKKTKNKREKTLVNQVRCYI